MAIQHSFMSARRSSRQTKSPHWLVYRIGGARGAMLGYIKASTEETALATAIVEFGLPEADRKRILVRRVVEA
jgi:hypothetical protein